MAKAIITAESDFDELVNDLLDVAQQFPDAIHEAAEEQMKVFESAIKANWVSMVSHGKPGDYVYDSIGYNVDFGTGTDVVGMAGVFLLDAVNAKHGKDTPIIKKNGARKEHIKAPQLAYWTEFGYSPNNGAYQPGIPFIGNAYHATLAEQDRVFADTLYNAITKRVQK